MLVCLHSVLAVSVLALVTVAAENQPPPSLLHRIFGTDAQHFQPSIFQQDVLHLPGKEAHEATRKARTLLFTHVDLASTFSKVSKIAPNSVQFVIEDEAANWLEDGSLSSEQILEKYHSSGHTLLMQAVETHNSQLGKLKCQLEAELFASVGINVYWTPPDAEGFKLHHDGHDVMVIQTIGSKCWLVCSKDSRLDTLSSQSFHYNINEHGIEAANLSVSCKNVSLSAGDILYLPRGVLHAPHTRQCWNAKKSQAWGGTRPEESMHVSIGIDVFGIRWATLMDTVVDQAYDAKEEYELEVTGDAPPTAPGSQLNEPVFPRLVASGATWTWVDILRSFVYNVEKESSATGHRMRSSLPLHRLMFSPKGRDHVLFGTGVWAPDKALWKAFEVEYDSLYDLMVSSCGKILRLELPAELKKIGVSEAVAEEETDRAASNCPFVLAQLKNNTSFLLALNKVVGYALLSHNERCGANSAPVNFQSDHWLSTIYDFSSLVNFFNETFSSNERSYKSHSWGVSIIMDLNVSAMQENFNHAGHLGPSGTSLVPTNDLKALVNRLNATRII